MVAAIGNLGTGAGIEEIVPSGGRGLTRPSPVPYNTMMSPGFAGFGGEFGDESWLNAAAWPVPDALAVNSASTAGRTGTVGCMWRHRSEPLFGDRSGYRPAPGPERDVRRKLAAIRFQAWATGINRHDGREEEGNTNNIAHADSLACFFAWLLQNQRRHPAVGSQIVARGILAIPRHV